MITGCVVGMDSKECMLKERNQGILGLKRDPLGETESRDDDWEVSL